MYKLTFLPTWVLAGCFVILIHHAGFAQEGITQPIDSSFSAFVDTLSLAIEKDDTSFIFSRLDPDVFNGFGYNDGKATFKQLWTDPHERLEEELQKALALGPAYDQQLDKIYVPYLWVTFPDTLDAYKYGYARYNSIPIYKKPDIGSAITGRLEKGWVNVFSWFEGDTVDSFSEPLWYGVATSSADTGFVQSDYIRSPIDYRFWFKKKNNRWILMGWAVGD